MRSRGGLVVFNAFARGEEDTRDRFLEWFWCSLCGCFMFFAAELRLEGWCIMTQLMGRLGVLRSHRAALLLAVPLC